MLRITIPAAELFDESTESFIYKKEQTLVLEHSLVSLSKWESKWNKTFLTKEDKTTEEVIDYVRCMTVTQNVDPEVYFRLSSQNIDDINAYIDAPMTATVINRQNRKGGFNREKVTSELIYYWMIALNIPFECQKWHLNRLLTLIEVCEIKSQPPKKMSKREIAARNSALNEARKQKLKTHG